MTTRIKRLLLAALCLALSGLAAIMPASAESSIQTTPWYQVEVMLVAYSNETMIDHESWPIALNDAPAMPVDYSGDVDFQWWIQPEGWSQPEAAALAWSGFAVNPKTPTNWISPLQPLPELSLAKQADQMKWRADMTVIWHQSWLEPIQAEDNAIQHPIDIELARPLDLHLTGHIQLHLSRYLHIKTDLVMQHYQQESSLFGSGSTQGFNSARTPYQLQQLPQSGALPNKLPTRAAHIQLTRRMRSRELHYLDHPMLGVVVRVIPVDDEYQLPESP